LISVMWGSYSCQATRVQRETAQVQQGMADFQHHQDREHHAWSDPGLFHSFQMCKTDAGTPNEHFGCDDDQPGDAMEIGMPVRMVGAARGGLT